MDKTLDIEFEKAVRLLSEKFPISDENTRKPVLFHDIRVGVYLYENNYSRNIVLAGLLHDAIEFSEIKSETISAEFGEEVLRLIKASTKDESIEKEKRNRELIERCIANGQDALIIKVADTIDSFKFYTKINNQDQLQNYCAKIADLIFELKPVEFNDKIFAELKTWQEKL
jgi:GTP pyrophosphokinase